MVAVFSMAIGQENYNPPTQTRDGCEMSQIYMVNPVTGNEFFTRAEVENMVLPTGWYLPEPADFAAIWHAPHNKLHVENQCSYFVINGVPEYRETVGKYCWHWVKTGDITTMKLWSTGRPPSWQFQKKGSPQSSSSALCKLILVKSHAPKIKLAGLQQKQKQTMTPETREYLGI